MTLSNAERQRAFRERRNEKARALDLTYAGMDDDATEFTRITLALMLCLLRNGESEAGIGLSDDTLNLEITADANELPDDVRRFLTGAGCEEWVSAPTQLLWEEGEPVRFQIRIQAIVDKRKRARVERRL